MHTRVLSFSGSHLAAGTADDAFGFFQQFDELRRNHMDREHVKGTADKAKGR
jgi:hypothetical protein